jgi:SAM-dependent methyltransferase
MSGFDLGWLDLREPADRAARDTVLLQAAAEDLNAGDRPLAVDLGCGSGSTFRALNPLLTRPTAWRLVDNDPLLLQAAAERAAPGQTVEPVLADLADAGRLPLQGATLVTASALLDLVSEAWIDALAAALTRAGAGLYAALTYDGEMSWSLAHPLDEAVAAAFNAHQRGDKGFGPALGPAATAYAVGRLEALGFTVATASTPWRLGRGEAALERELVAGIADAAIATGRLERTEVEAWRKAREAAAGSGCAIGHLDLLAQPPG